MIDMSHWHRFGPMNSVRWWMFMRLHGLGWAVCPEPERSIFRSLWNERLGQWNAELDAACEKREAHLRKLIALR